jgi:hypothetical protein
MTQYDYIVLSSSDNSITGKFTVIQEGYNPSLEAIQNVSDTIDGGVDVQVGPIVEIRGMLIKCRHTEDRVGYGTLATLESLFRLRNPKGTPSNIITYTDNLGSQYQVIFIDNWQQALLAHQVEGLYAWSLIKITLRILAAI